MPVSLSVSDVTVKGDSFSFNAVTGRFFIFQRKIRYLFPTLNFMAIEDYFTIALLKVNIHGIDSINCPTNISCH